MDTTTKWRRVYTAIQYCEAQPTYNHDLKDLISCVVKQTGLNASEVKSCMNMAGGY